jgi:DNA-binding CsgD family transcriptional regulator
VLDDKIWGRVAVTVLELAEVAVVACNADQIMLATSSAARRLLARFATDSVELGTKLPRPLAQGLRKYLAATDTPGAGRIAPIRVATLDDQSSVFVRCHRSKDLQPVALVVWFHEEVVRDTALLAALQDAFGISARDFRLIQQIRLGQSNREIARVLGLTEATVKTYLHALFETLDVRSRMELVARVERIRRGD